MKREVSVRLEKRGEERKGERVIFRLRSSWVMVDTEKK